MSDLPIGLWIRHDVTMHSDGRVDHHYDLCGNKYFDTRDQVTPLTAKNYSNPMIRLSSWQAEKILNGRTVEPGESIEI